MSPKTFSRLSRQYFGTFLAPYGFLTTRENSPLYYRINEHNIYHIISPRLGSRGVWFDIMVYGHSPQLRDTFNDDFPENLTVPSGGLSYLHPKTGVGIDQKLYRSRTEEGFVRNFKNEAKPALEHFGLPYLDKLKTLDDVIATIPDNGRHLWNIPPDKKDIKWIRA